MRKRRIYRLQQQAMCDRWNENNPIGTDVHLVKDDGTIIHTKTRSGAHTLGSGTAVIWVEGIAGCYLLERVRPIKSD